MASPAVRAATLVWTNTAGGAWNVAANWSPNALPAAATIAGLTVGDPDAGGTPINRSAELDFPDPGGVGGHGGGRPRPGRSDAPLLRLLLTVVPARASAGK